MFACEQLNQGDGRSPPLNKGEQMFMNQINKTNYNKLCSINNTLLQLLCLHELYDFRDAIL